MGVSIEDLMAQLEGTDPETEPVEEKQEASVEEDVKNEEVPETDPLEGLVVEPKDIPEPEPVKKPRGRPRTTKAKVVEKAPEPEKETVTEATVVADKISDVVGEAIDVAPTTIEQISAESVLGSGTIKADPVDGSLGVEKDIYVLQDVQIINGHVYRRGQKITFRKGDKFYNSQTDRHGKNWLDYVDDPDAQFAYFGKLIVEADKWSGIPLGSVENINHPGVALAISKFAQEEYERNGVPFSN